MSNESLFSCNQLTNYHFNNGFQCCVISIDYEVK